MAHADQADQAAQAKSGGQAGQAWQADEAECVQDTTVVVATRNRCPELLCTLVRLLALPEVREVVVVDNASTDGTVEEVRHSFPSVTVIPLPFNAGAAARNVGARHARTPLLAFSDDDSWWAPGSLARAAALFHRAERLALVAARVMVEPEGSIDPTCAVMAASPRASSVEGSSGPYREVLGFLACGAVVRRDAFLAAGGFCPELMVGGEEALLAIDLAVGGWDRCYVPDVVAHHRPSASRDARARRRIEVRNALWTVWIRRRPWPAARRTVSLVRDASRTGTGVRGVYEAVVGASWALHRRAAVPRRLEAALQEIERLGR